jgi:16S rRNA (cytidine1402-2'-O)-methyltransferase
MPGTLYVVATPIGNSEDITLRALRILGAVDLIAAEDTRHTGKLLKLHGIKGRFVSFHEHNEVTRAPQLLGKLQNGASVAVVSNAGTPSVSDPGYRLVTAAIQSAIPVVPVPGVSAVTTALSVSGLPVDAFSFLGFAPRKSGKRRKFIENLATLPGTLVLYESPRRLLPLMADILSVLGDRPCVIGREMTKRHEEFLRGRLSNLLERLKTQPSIKGECSLLVSGAPGSEAETEDWITGELRNRLSGGGRELSEVVREMAREYHLPKNDLYNRALKIRNTSTKMVT